MKFATIFRSLAAEKVRYCVLGRTAAVYYGLQVVTMDIDIILSSDRANTMRFFKALRRMGATFQLPSTMEMELFESQKVSRFMIGDLVLDVLKWQEGFSTASWTRVRKARYLGTTVRIADLHDLIQTKSQTPRRKDKADVRALQKILINQKETRK